MIIIFQDADVKKQLATLTQEKEEAITKCKVTTCYSLVSFLLSVVQKIRRSIISFIVNFSILNQHFLYTTGTLVH